MRPVLRPGLQIMRRDLRTFQLGHEWPGVGALLDTAVVRAVLAAVDGYRDLAGVVDAATDVVGDAEAVGTTADGLIAAGVLVDQADTRRPGDVPEAAWNSLWLLAGPGRTAHQLHAARRRVTVAVQGDGSVAERIRSLLADARLATTHDSADADIEVVASDWPPDRATADVAMRSGLPHLWAYVCDLVGVVGPLVEPGRSACLRCLDAARREVDPAWPTVVEAASIRRLAAPACGPTLAAVVAALAVQQVDLWACGERPQTVEEVLEIPHGLGPVQAVPHQPHPHCGCGWSGWHDTMGA